ncbi:MAG: zf-HC2 domain-containing protein [Verrucomicrobia bacterium]|nr:zf-HC2 domain-containing protein [Verrucomicrobiota bacterium]
MNCERANEVLMLDLYGEADTADAAELKAHLAGCAACRRAAKASRVALAEFRREAAPRPSRETVEAVLAAAQPRPRLASLFAQLRPALWQAAAVVAVALTASVAIKFWPQPPEQLAAANKATMTQAADADTSWDADSAALSDRLHLAQADVAIGSSLDNRIAGLRDALSELRGGSDRF